MRTALASSFSARLVRQAACLGLAAACAALALTLVFALRWGPVIAVLDAEGGHGVHSGDLFAFPLMATGLLFALLGRHPSRVATA